MEDEQADDKPKQPYEPVKDDRVFGVHNGMCIIQDEPNNMTVFKVAKMAYDLERLRERVDELEEKLISLETDE